MTPGGRQARPRGARFRAAGALLGALALAAPLAGQDPAATRPRPGDTIRVIPHSDFAAEGLKRVLFGRTFRSLWLSPIRLEVADLASLEGGIETVARSGNSASRPFYLQGKSGISYGFRELVKDATLDWPPQFRTATARRLAQDQISSTIPGGAFAVIALERAAGLFHPQPRLVMLPDDPRLGEWREAFAYRLGLLEPRLRGDIVPGAQELLDSPDLFQRLREDGRSAVDARAFLTARLIDLLVGDWDRHEGQWTWARFDQAGSHRWVPVTEDRDWAFNRQDGLIWGLVRMLQPKFQKFGPGFGGLRGLLFEARPLDRRLLVSLDRPAWDSVVQRLVTRLNDAAITRAVGALPDGLDPASVAWIRETLIARRERLPEVAGAFYRDLAEEVELWVTEGDDRVELREDPDEGLTIEVHRAGARAPWRRRFLPGETREVRIYTLSGADRITGMKGRSPITLRVIHAGTLAVEPGVRHLERYDSSRVFLPPVPAHDPGDMFRDWGDSLAVVPWVNYHSGLGLLLGGGVRFTHFGFRRVPFASQVTFRAAGVTGFPGVNFDFTGEFQPEARWHRFRIKAEILSSDYVRYFGIGNETPRTESREFYIVRRERYRFEPGIVVRVAPRINWTVSGVAQFTETDLERPTLARVEQPYGFGNFAELGAHTRIELDARNHSVYPTWGVRAFADGSYFPRLADVREPFGTVQAELNAYATATPVPTRPTLAVRVGGTRAIGDAPFFEAPAVGGRRSLRGYSSRRFVGDKALYASAELRLDLGKMHVIPGSWGIFGLRDYGRVYQDGVGSSVWHRSWGAGVWLAAFDRQTTVTITYAKSPEPDRFYLGLGFHY